MRRRGSFEPLEQRSLLSATIFQHEDISYFVNGPEHQLERYDLAAEEWLSPVVLPEHVKAPSAAMIDDFGLYVAYGGELFRYAQDGTGEALVYGYSGDVTGLYSEDAELMVTYLQTSYTSKQLYVNHIDRQYDYRSWGQILSTNSDGEWAIAQLPSLDRLMVRTVDHYLYNSIFPVGYDGARENWSVALLSSDFETPQLWVFPGTNKILDTTGSVFNVVDSDPSKSHWVGHLTGFIDDVTFLPDGSFVARRGTQLTHHNAALLPMSTRELDSAPIEIVTSDGGVFAFFTDATAPAGMRAEQFAVADFEPIQAEPVNVNPTGLAFTPDAIAATTEGTVLLLSGEHRALFTWNSSTQSYSQTIPLLGVPQQMTYSAELNRAYLSYPSGLITKVQFGEDPREVPFTAMPNRVRTMAAAGKYLIALDDYSYYDTKFVFSEDGTVVSQYSDSRPSDEIVWSDANQKAYYLMPDGWSNRDLFAVEVNARGDAYPGKPPGAIGRTTSADRTTTTYNGEPIRIATDGSLVAFGSGDIVDARTMTRLDTPLPNGFLDATWLTRGLYSIRELNGETQVQAWGDPRLPIQQLRVMPGAPLRITAVGADRVLVIAMGANSIPQFHLMNSELEDLSNPIGIDIRLPPGGLVVRENGATASFQIALTARPLSNVRLKLTSLDPTQVVISHSKLLFTPSNWNVPKTVTVRAIDDAAIDYTQFRLISVSVDDAFAAVEYRSAPNHFVEVANLDDESVVVNLLEHAGVAYSFIESEARVERYDLTARAWLPTITLSELPGRATLAHVDADGLYIAYGKTVYRYNLDGTGGVRLIEMKSKVHSIHADGNLLFISTNVHEYIDTGDGGNNRDFVSIATFNKNTNQKIALFEKEYFPFHSELFFPELNEFHSASGAILFYTDEGILSAPIREGISNAQSEERTRWLSPDSSLFVERDGDLYRVRHQHPGGGHQSVVSEYLGRLATHVTDVAFLADGSIIVLDGQTLTRFVAGLPVGSVSLDQAAWRVIAGDGEVTAFTLDPVLLKGVQSRTFRFADFVPPSPAPVVDPTGLAYEPEAVELASNATVLLLDQQSRNVFRWDSTSQRYLPSIPLIGEAIRMSYAPATNYLYLAYATGLITRIDLGDPTFEETPFATVPDQVRSLQAAGLGLFVSQATHFETGYLFGADGTLLDWFEMNGVGNGINRQYTWSESTQTLFTIDYRLAARTIHSDYVGFWDSSFDSNAYPDPVYPLHVTADGKFVVSASGHVFDATTRLPLRVALPDALVDLTSSGDGWYTIGNVGGATQVRKYVGERLEQVAERNLAGQAKIILSPADGRLIVHTAGANGRPTFAVLDSELNVIPPPAGLLITESGGNTVVREAQDGDQITVALRQQPAGQVVIQVTVDNAGELTLDKSVLVFTPQNWNAPQAVTVAAPADSVADGNRQISVQFHIESSLGFDDGGLRDRFVSVTTLDAETTLGATVEHEGIVYLFSNNDGRVERYDTIHQIALTPLQLQQAPTGISAALIDEDAIYVAYGRDLFRFSRDGSDRRHILNVPGHITAIHVDDDLLFVSDSMDRVGRLLSLNKHTFELLDAYEARSGTANDRIGSEIQPGPNRILGFRDGNGEAVIAYTYNNNGKFTGSISEYQFDFDRAPDFLPQSYDDIAYAAAGHPILLAGNVVTIYGSGAARGTVSFTQAPLKIAAFGDQLFVFLADVSRPTGYRVEQFGIAELLPPVSPVHPLGLNFAPDQTEVATDGTVFLLSQLHRSIFRWDSHAQAFVPTIRLSELAEQMVYSPAENALYVAYRSGRIVKFAPNGLEFLEIPIATLASRPLAFTAAGEYLVALDDSGPGNTLYLFSRSGVLLDSRVQAGYAPELFWSDDTQRLSLVPQDASPPAFAWQEIETLGPGIARFGSQATTAFTDTYRPQAAGFSAAAKLILLESGRVYDTTSFGLRYALNINFPYYYSDGFWIGNVLYALRVGSDNATVVKINVYATPTTVFGASGAKAWLEALPGERLMFASFDSYGRLRLEVLDRDLRRIEPPQAQVVGRHLFYNNSVYDRNADPHRGDDAAIATDKTAYVPGADPQNQPNATYQNVSSYSRGINGLMIDLAGNLGANISNISRYYFRFTVGNNNDPTSWTEAPSPSEFRIRPGEGAGGSTRFEFIWPDGAIMNTWLRVDVLPALNLPADTFYFGNLVGETGGAPGRKFTVTAADMLATRDNAGLRLPVTAVGDHNRDGKISAADFLIARSSVSSTGLTVLRPSPVLLAATHDDDEAQPTIKDPLIRSSAANYPLNDSSDRQIVSSFSLDDEIVDEFDEDLVALLASESAGNAGSVARGMLIPRL